MADDELSFENLTFGDDSKNSTQDVRDYQNNNIDQDDLDHNKKNEEPEKNVIFVSATSYSDKLNHSALIKLAEEFGLKNSNFRDKQSFGFLQFKDEESYEKALEKFNNLDIDGTKVIAEKTARITPGRDPRTHEANSEFKNSTLVLKNLPFQLKQEKLEEILNNYTVKPLNVSYLYDSTGMFRGMAFVKYKEIEHATTVFENLNNLDITGRKVRVEYKRVTKENEQAESTEEKKIQDQLNNFRANVQINELAFNPSSSFQKKQIRQIAEKLGLGHYSTGDFIVIKKSENDKVKSPESYRSHSVSSGSSSGLSSGLDAYNKAHPQGQPIKGRRRGLSDPRSPGGDKIHNPYSTSYDNHHNEPDRMGTSIERNNSKGIAISKSVGGSNHNSFHSHSPGLVSSFTHLKSPPNASLLGSSPTYRNSAALMVRRDEYPVQPSRQPKGPDGSLGFSEEYKQQRIAKKPQPIN